MRLFVSLILLLLSSTAFAATSERFGKGGWIKDFQPEIDRANSSGELFRIKGHCQSLCTLFLACTMSASSAAPRCCFMPGTTASATSTPVRPSACSTPTTRRSAYVTEKGYMNTLEFHAIPGSMIIDKFGYKECPRS